MKPPLPWFRPDWRELYARQLARMIATEALAKAAGRKIRP